MDLKTAAILGLLGGVPLGYGVKCGMDQSTVNLKTGGEEAKRALETLFLSDKSSDVFQTLKERIECPTTSTMCSGVGDSFSWADAGKAILHRPADMTPRAAAVEFLKGFRR